MAHAAPIDVSGNGSFIKNLSRMFKTADGNNYARIFVLICTLFLLWGFSMGLIDVLNKHFQEVLHISKADSGFVQFAYYMGYFLMAIPAGFFAKKFGYKSGIIMGLSLVAVGALWSMPATKIGTYFIFLVGLFVLASGLSFLETVANPYSTVLGPPEMGAARINLAQSCNAFGQMLGPLIGGQIILSPVVGGSSGSNNLYLPYFGIAVIVIILLTFFFFVKVPDVHAMDKCEIEVAKGRAVKPFWHKWHFNFAIVAQLFYIIAQTGIYSFFINYTTIDIPGCSDRNASVCLAVGGFGLFLLGRVIGSFILRKIKPYKALAFYGVANVLLMFIVIFGKGIPGFLALTGSFFFMSIMFPTIFALGIFGLGKQTKQASSFIVMTIVGGAFTPVMGYIADITNINTGFFIPLICFLVVFVYAIFWKKLEAISC